MAIAGISGISIVLAVGAAAIAIILDDGSCGVRTFTMDQSFFTPAQTLPDPRGFTSDKVVKNVFVHLHSIDSFTISGEFDAWRQHEASNTRALQGLVPAAPHEIHGWSATVIGEFVGPDKFES